MYLTCLTQLQESTIVYVVKRGTILKVDCSSIIKCMLENSVTGVLKGSLTSGITMVIGKTCGDNISLSCMQQDFSK